MAEVRAALADRVVQREAARVLRHMAKARLERRGPGGYVLCQKPGGRAKLVVEAAIVEAFQERGWVSPAADGRLALASEGRIWLSASRSADPHGFRGQHGEIESLPGGLRVDRATAPLDFLKRHREADGSPFLTADQCAAADRLQEDFEAAQLRPRLTSDPMQPIDRWPRGPGVAEHLTSRALDARRRCFAALEAAGPGLCDLLFDVVCLARGLNEAERGFGWPQRSGKAILRLALDRLALHYGLISGRRNPGRIEAWRAALEAPAPA